MSVATSREERAAAAARLADAPEEQLVRDLAYWSVTAREHQATFAELAHRQGEVREQYAEAEAWAELHADAIRARRGAGKKP